jgi:hypothetical protein
MAAHLIWPEVRVARLRSAAFSGREGRRAPKQSELNRAPVRLSMKPVVMGLS